MAKKTVNYQIIWRTNFRSYAKLQQFKFNRNMHFGVKSGRMAHNYNNFSSRFGVFLCVVRNFYKLVAKRRFWHYRLNSIQKNEYEKTKKLQICLGSFEKGRKYHSNRDYSQKSLHQIFQSKFLQFSRYESDNDKK